MAKWLKSTDFKMVKVCMYLGHVSWREKMSCKRLSPMFLPYFMSTNRENLGIKSLYFSSIPTINLCANKFYGKYVQAKTWRIHRNFPISYQRF